MRIRPNGLTGTSTHGLGISHLHIDQPVPASSTEAGDTSTKILDIIYEHALDKFDDSKERLAAGKANFLSVIDRFVLAGERVEACLPAFPFKSANKVYKVLGSLPDKAEELALQRLNHMCARIKGVYKPGARVTIISDGITYNGMYLSLLQIVSTDTLNKTFCRYPTAKHGSMARLYGRWRSRRSSRTLPSLA